MELPDKFNGKDNKLLTASKSQQSVTNLAINPSFNRDTANFTTYKAAANSNSVTIDSNKGHIGKKSAKFTQTASNRGRFGWDRTSKTCPPASTPSPPM